jgi:cation transport ATPase
VCICVLLLQVELAVVSTSISVSPPSLLRMSLQVNGMDCASCSKMVEDGVKRLDSVRTATCSVMTGLAEVAYTLNDSFDVLPAEQASEQMDAIVQQIVKLIHAMGYQCELLRSWVVSSHPNKASSSLMEETPALLVHLVLILSEKEHVGSDLLSSTCAMLLLMPGVSSSMSRSRDKSDSSSSSSLLLIGYQPDVIGARTLLKAVEQHVGQSVSVGNSDEAVGGAGEVDLAAVWRTRFLVCLLFTVPLFVIVYLLPAGGSDSSTMRAMHHEITPGLRVSSLVGFLLALPVQVYGGWPLFLSAYRAARFGRKLNIDALVALSTTVAFLYSIATTIASMAGQPLLGT